MVTRPVMAIIATTIRLSCRNVVLETLFCIGWKSAKMFIGGFLLVGLVLVDTTLLQKPSQLSLFLAKVLIIQKVIWLQFEVGVVRSVFYSQGVIFNIHHDSTTYLR